MPKPVETATGVTDRGSDAETNRAAWDRRARQRADTERAGPAPVGTRIDWTQHPGHGPSAELLGELTGRRVVELGCGPGDTIAHLAARHDADATGVDASPAQIARARTRFGHISGLRFTVNEASTWLAGDTTPTSTADRASSPARRRPRTEQVPPSDLG